MLLLNLMLAGRTDLLAVLLQERQLTDEVSGDVAGSFNPVSGGWSCAVEDPTIPSSWIFCPIAAKQKEESLTIILQSISGFFFNLNKVSTLLGTLAIQFDSCTINVLFYKLTNTCIFTYNVLL